MGISKEISLLTNQELRSDHNMTIWVIFMKQRMLSLKNLIKRHKALKHLVVPLYRLVVPLYRFTSDMCYNTRVKWNIPFAYSLQDKQQIRLRPQGQIARGILTHTFEEEDVSLFAALLKPGMNVVDVGANIGFYTLVASAKVQKSGSVWAFEPSSKTFDLLLENLKLNAFTTNVTPINLGLGSQTYQKIELRRDRGFGDGEKYIIPEGFIPPKEQINVTEKVETEIITLTTLDAYMKKAGNKRVDFVKMDVEGYEYFALQGARETILANPDVVLLLECTELGTTRAGHTKHDVLNFISSMGLQCFYFDSGINNWKMDQRGIYLCASSIHYRC